MVRRIEVGIWASWAPTDVMVATEPEGSPDVDGQYSNTQVNRTK